MEGETFDHLVKRLTAARFTRLDALRGLAASALTGLVGGMLAATEGAAKPHHKRTRTGHGRRGDDRTGHGQGNDQSTGRDAPKTGKGPVHAEGKKKKKLF